MRCLFIPDFRRAGLAAACIAVVLAGWAAQAQAGLILPPPPGVIDTVLDANGDLREAILIDGVPVAFKYDDFWSYSAKLLAALQAAGHIPAYYGDYQFATGTGGLDVLIYTGSAGANNQNVGPGGAFDFEDPLRAPAGSQTTFDGVWGNRSDKNGPVTVGNLLAYLNAVTPGNNTPLFYFDNNQTGSNPSLLGSAKVSIINPDDNSEVAFWAFDTITNNQYDPTGMALAFGQVSFTGTSGTVYSVNHNTGSGKPDFLMYAPGMDLSQYPSHYLFVGTLKLGGLNNGPEELFLSGNFQSVVPEPSTFTLMLLGAGLPLIGRLRRRSQSRASVE